MTNVAYDSIEEHNCIATFFRYDKLIRQGKSPEEALRLSEKFSRDNARTPYQWDDSGNAGFSTGKPWLKVNPRYKEINLKKDLASPDSIFRHYRALADLRKEHPAIISGDLNFYLETDPDVIVYTRACKEETLLIIANKSSKERAIALPKGLQRKGKILLSNMKKENPLAKEMNLAPWEAIVYQI